MAETNNDSDSDGELPSLPPLPVGPSDGGGADVAAAGPAAVQPSPCPPHVSILAVKVRTYKNYFNGGLQDAHGIIDVPITEVNALLKKHPDELQVLEVVVPPGLLAGGKTMSAAILEACPSLEVRKAITGIKLARGNNLLGVFDDVRLPDVLPSWCTLEIAGEANVDSSSSSSSSGGGSAPEHVRSCITAVRISDKKLEWLNNTFPVWQASMKEVQICRDAAGSSNRVRLLPDDLWTRFPSLIILDLSGCKSLQALPESIGGCTSLTTLDVSGCFSLQALPESIGGCTSLATLNVVGCSRLQTLPESIGGCTSLTMLNVVGCSSLQALPESIGGCTSLTTLDVRGCDRLQALPESIGGCTSLTTIGMPKAAMLIELSTEALSKLTKLKITDNNATTLPEFIGGCTSLATLDVSFCSSLQALPESIGGCTSLTTLDVRYCSSLQALPESIGRCTSLTTLNVSGCFSLQALPESIGRCTSLTTLNVSGCFSLEALPESIDGCTSLTTLNVRYCSSLQALPESIGGCTSLTMLNVSECSSLQALPESIGGCTSLTTLDARECPSLQALPESIGGCTSLTTLDVSYCDSLQALPESIGGCTSLTMLNASYCKSLQALPESIGGCTSLTTLNVRSCSSLTRFPSSLSRLKDSLTEFTFYGCPSLVFPPASVASNGGAAAVFAFMHAAAAGSRQLARDRLMLIGDGGSGKTTLRAALLWSPDAAQKLQTETRKKVNAWSPAHVQQWVLEISDDHAELASRFSAIPGKALLELNAEDVVKLCEGTYRNDVVDKVARMVAMLAAKAIRDTAGMLEQGRAPATRQAVRLDSLETTEQFVGWLQSSLGTTLAAAITDALNECAITGDVASDMTEADWKEVVPQLNFGTRRKILKQIANCRAAETAASALTTPAPTTAAAASTQPAEPAQPRSTYAPLLDLPHVWTDGIEVESWTDGGYQLWDFAGQLEYYPAHQFFLSAANTVYLLVADASKGYDHCLLRLQHWLSFLRSAIRGSDAAYGPGPTQRAPAHVLIVATHTDVPAFQRGGNFLPDLAATLAAQFVPKIKINSECFSVDYNAHDGGGLTQLKETLADLRADEIGRIECPASYHTAFAALKAAAVGNPERSIMTLPRVCELIDSVGDGGSSSSSSSSSGDDGAVGTSPSADDSIQQHSVLLGTLEAFGMLKQLGKDSEMMVLIDPVTWLTQITSAFVAPKLQAAMVGYETEVDAVPSTSLREVKQMLRDRGIAVANVQLIVDVLINLKLCFRHTQWRGRGGNEDGMRVIVPAMLPPAPQRDRHLVHGRRFRCKHPEDSIPATLMATVQAAIYNVADEVLVVRAGFIEVTLCGCNVVVRLSSPKDVESSSSSSSSSQRAHSHYCSGAIDVLHDADADGERHEALNLAVLVVVGAWKVSFESVPLAKSLLAPHAAGDAGEVETAEQGFESEVHPSLHQRTRDGSLQSERGKHDFMIQALRSKVAETISAKSEEVQEKYVGQIISVFEGILRSSVPESRYRGDVNVNIAVLLTDPAIVTEHISNDISSAPTTLPLPSAEEVGRMLCPHLHREPVHSAVVTAHSSELHRLKELLLGDDQVHKAAVHDLLTKGADWAVGQIGATDLAAHTAAAFSEQLQASVASATERWNGAANEYKQPLHARLAAVKQVMARFAHTIIAHCSHTQPSDAAKQQALMQLSQMVLEPAVRCMRSEVQQMLADVSSDSASYKTQMEELAAPDRSTYSNEFHKITSGPPLGTAQDIVDFQSVCNEIGLLRDQTERSSLPPRRQPEADMLQLSCICVAAMPVFKATIETLFAGVLRVELQFRPEAKSLYRIAEKALLKGRESKANGGDGVLLPEGSPLDCSSICDVVGCLVVCDDFVSMREVVTRLREQQEPDVTVYDVKDRWTNSSGGGWRDLICILALGPRKVMCEVQVAHKKMVVARKGLDAHKSYAEFRNYSELLSFTGL